MTDQSRRSQEYRRALAKAPKLELIEWHSLSVVRYVGGEQRAWHNRLDKASRKLVTVQLCDPKDPTTDLPWHVLALTNAAEELEVAHRLQGGLW